MNPQCSILVADDDGDIRELLRILLSKEGYRVLEAADGREANPVTVCIAEEDINVPVIACKININLILLAGCYREEGRS